MRVANPAHKLGRLSLENVVRLADTVSSLPHVSRKMASEPIKISASSRRELFDFLDAQMHSSYRSLRDEQRAVMGSNMIKSYVFEVAHSVDTVEDAKSDY